MKFLIIHHLKDSFYALPSEKQSELIKGGFAFADKYLKNGAMKMAYIFSDGKAVAGIWDVNSSEELMRIFLEYPATPYSEGKFIPVVEYEATGKIMKEMMAAAQKAPKK